MYSGDNKQNRDGSWWLPLGRCKAEVNILSVCAGVKFRRSVTELHLKAVWLGREDLLFQCVILMRWVMCNFVVYDSRVMCVCVLRKDCDEVLHFVRCSE